MVGSLTMARPRGFGHGPIEGAALPVVRVICRIMLCANILRGRHINGKVRWNDEADRAVANCSISCYSGRMARTIAQRDLRNENAKVIDAVTAGETFVVTRNGEPVAELRPIRAGRRTFISRDEVASLAGAAVRIDHRRFRADLDKLIDQGL